MINRDFAIEYFKTYWAENKAKGLLAESSFSEFLGDQEHEIFRHGTDDSSDADSTLELQ